MKRVFEELEKAYNSIDAGRREKIRLLAEDEFYYDRIDYIICENAEGQRRYVHETKVTDETGFAPMDAEQARAYRNKIHIESINAPALTPIELRYKEDHLNYIREEDRKIHGHVGKEKFRQREIAEISDYYNEAKKDRFNRLKYRYIAGLILIFIVVYIYVVDRVDDGVIRITYPELIRAIELNHQPLPADSIVITGLTEGAYVLHIVTASGETLRQTVTIYSNDTVNVDFSPAQRRRVINDVISDIEAGHVRVMANLSDFTAKLNNRPITPGTWHSIQPGKHLFEVSKAGYQAIPSFRSLYVGKGDSLDINFLLQELISDKSVFRATLDVTANVSGAEILINGKPTGYTTDYLFANRPAGTYQISVRKVGYTVENNNQTIRITSNQTYYPIQFRLKATSGYAAIETSRSDADIRIDGKRVGTGSVTQLLPAGSHQVSFGEVNGFYTPATRTITIRADETTTLNVDYYPVIRYEGRVSGRAVISSDLSVTLGHVSLSGQFIEGSTRPIESGSVNGKPSLKLSYPNAYNNPKAGHALRIRFQLPSSYRQQQPMSLVLGIYKTSESYSVDGTQRAKMSILVNNQRTLLNQAIQHSVDNAGQTQRFRINRMLRAGANEIVLFLTADNSTVIELTHIAIKP